jgi:hypothetical protein
MTASSRQAITLQQFLHHITADTILWPTQFIAICSADNWYEVSFAGVKQVVCGGDHSPPPSAKAKLCKATLYPPFAHQWLFGMLEDSLLFYGHPAE